MELLDEKLKYHQLYDIYGCLLTDKQRAYFSYHYFDDYSLSEIAKIMNVTRNAVHDQIKNTLSILDYYEEKMSLLSKRNKRQSIFKKAKEDLSKEGYLGLITELEKVE